MFNSLLGGSEPGRRILGLGEPQEGLISLLAALFQGSDGRLVLFLLLEGASRGIAGGKGA